jgi:hypothetical protein
MKINWKITLLLVLVVSCLILDTVEGAKKSSKTTSKKTSSKTTSKKTTSAKSASAAAKTLCETYASKAKMSQEEWMTGIIQDVEMDVTNPKNDLAQYFNGTTPSGSRNFVDPENRDLLHQLTVRLVAFFGELIGCNERDFPSFKKTANFRRLHHRMMISESHFNNFNAAVATAMKNAGVSQSDTNKVATVLAGFKDQVVFSKRVPHASLTGFPPVPSNPAKTTSKKTTSKKTTSKKTSTKKTSTKKTSTKKTSSKKST